MNKIYFAVVIAIAVVVASILNPAYGFFHDNDPKPPKPQMQLNPVIQAEFDNLYNKYPHITQQDIDTSYNILVQDCLQYQQESDTFMAEFICKGINTGLMQNYLENLGLKLEPSTAEYGNVGKSPQLWDANE